MCPPERWAACHAGDGPVVPAERDGARPAGHRGPVGQILVQYNILNYVIT